MRMLKDRLLIMVATDLMKMHCAHIRYKALRGAGGRTVGKHTVPTQVYK